ncbi:MAG: RelE/StbE replicon stabilization toxin [uncultured Sulfurovum sp.]|uniref:RelE/StbE replicon stabilization toxin n=1 Tax=uncultured Sulfurovum sp. TaxID=269237 RepID=A0A6S6TPW9_9BACT|nr:MAG: RelE/StbE replicon stabilization toxin [uncultured Sulfurovum sp.]
MTVVIDDKALKDLSKIQKQDAHKIFLKIEALDGYPDVANIKKLTNFEPPYRLRVGNYRVLFDIEDDTITVYRVKHRSKSYE